MFQNESDDYSVSQIKNIIVSALYDNNVLCGYQKKIQFIDGFYHKKNMINMVDSLAVAYMKTAF